MGTIYDSARERRQAEARMRERRAQEEAVRRRKEGFMKLADKIAMAVVDRVNAKVIRPGPVAEERECYDMAKEMHDAKAELASLIADILVAENVEFKA